MLFPSWSPRVDDGVIGGQPPSAFIMSCVRGPLPRVGGDGTFEARRSPWAPPSPTDRQNEAMVCQGPHPSKQVAVSGGRRVYGHIQNVAKAAFSSDIRQPKIKLGKTLHGLSSGMGGRWTMPVCRDWQIHTSLPTASRDGWGPSLPRGQAGIVPSFPPSKRPDLTLRLGHLFEGPRSSHRVKKFREWFL